MYKGHKICKFLTNSRGTTTPPLDETADSQTSCSVGINKCLPASSAGPHHGVSLSPMCNY